MAAAEEEEESRGESVELWIFKNCPGRYDENNRDANLSLIQRRGDVATTYGGILPGLRRCPDPHFRSAKP